MTRVSIVIPTHNRPELLRRALQSVQNQTYRDFEVLVVDDGEKKAEAVVKEFTAFFTCRYLETAKNEGGAVARNLGIKNATGEFVAFLDDDDEWQPEKLVKQVQAFDVSSPTVSLVFSGVEAYDQTGKMLYTRLPGESGECEPFRRLLHKCYIWTSALMIRRQYAEQGFIFDPLLKKNQEWDLELRLSKVSKFYALNEPLTRINIGESEQMGSKKNLPNIIAGTEMFLHKHEADYQLVPTAWCLRLFNLGYLHWNNGDSAKARRLWLQAWRLNKTNLIPLKHWLVMGWGKGFLRLVKKQYKKTRFYRSALFKKDWQKARDIVEKLFPENKEATRVVDTFCRSTFFKRHFSYGHSGDFDVIMLYSLVRLTRPAVVVETGVASGRSSAAILMALKENDFGRLYSIDLPQHYEAAVPETYVTSEGNQELKGFVPAGQEPGWLVGDELRARWELILGDSKIVLPKLLQTLSTVGIFYHDSDHSYEAMMFEFNLAWPKIIADGFLLSDDIKWNKSWVDFIERVKPAVAESYRNFGISRK